MSTERTPGAFGRALAALRARWAEDRRAYHAVPRLERRRLEREAMREQKRGRRAKR